MGFSPLPPAEQKLWVAWSLEVIDPIVFSVHESSPLVLLPVPRLLALYITSF